MKKVLLIISVVLMSITTLISQNETDALRYSYLIPGGTARSMAMGGSFGALGADASNLMFNPAGMGIYRSSDFSFSPAFEITNTDANFLGSVANDYDFNFNINNLSYIGVIPVNSTNGLNNVNLGISYNRLNNFHENILIEGKNPHNSMTNWFAENGAGLSYDKLDNFYSDLAWQSYLIDLDLPDTTHYLSAFNGNYDQTQKQYISRNGSQGEYNFAASANIMHKLFIGVSLGLQSVRFTEVKTLHEIDTDDNINDFNSFSFKESLETSGSGINFKLGLIYSPMSWLRIGGAIHTPTFYKLRDNYYTSVNSSFEDGAKSTIWDSPYGTFDYEINTPFRANASLGFIIAKQALVNIDYEYVDYSMSRLRSNDYAFFDENTNIRKEYKNAHNIKLGLEYRYGPLSFRAGGAYYDSPYKSENHPNKNSYSLVYSGGVGIRGEFMYFDIGYAMVTNESSYYMYQGDIAANTSPVTDISKNQSRIITTIGFKF
ncbi:MAG: outer membrane protein transport protein [Bacteroidales bacterium]|nr:outer membrane protein transport protein [Bacteroidales bacterium]